MFSRTVLPFLLATFTAFNNVHGTGGAPNMIVDPEGITNPSAQPPISSAYGAWDDWESWEPSQYDVKAFPAYRSGYDNDGLVVYVVSFGMHNFRELATMSQERIEDVWKAYEQFTRWMEKDAALNNGQGIVMVIDFDGFTLASYASPEALKFGLKVFSYLHRQHNSVKYGFMLNVNYAAESFINLARPFIGTFLDVFEIYGTRSEIWKSTLLRKIPASQLAEKYGGSKDWKCLAPAYRC